MKKVSFEVDEIDVFNVLFAKIMELEERIEYLEEAYDVSDDEEFEDESDEETEDDDEDTEEEGIDLDNLLFAVLLERDEIAAELDKTVAENKKLRQIITKLENM